MLIDFIIKLWDKRRISKPIIKSKNEEVDSQIHKKWRNRDTKMDFLIVKLVCWLFIDR